MGSTRVPGKVMLPLAGRPVIWHIQDRLRRTRGVAEVVLATTRDPRNDAMAAYAEEIGLQVHRAEVEDDIAGRLAGAVRQTGAEAVLKVNGDCPLADPEVMGLLVDRFRAEAGMDYVSNKSVWSYPLGLSVEMISRRALEWCDENLAEPGDRELVADWIRRHPERFRVASVESARDLSHHHWAVDEPEDVRFMEEVFGALYRDGEAFGMAEVLDYLDGARARRRGSAP